MNFLLLRSGTIPKLRGRTPPPPLGSAKLQRSLENTIEAVKTKRILNYSSACSSEQHLFPQSLSHDAAPQHRPPQQHLTYQSWNNPTRVWGGVGMVAMAASG